MSGNTASIGSGGSATGLILRIGSLLIITAAAIWFISNLIVVGRGSGTSIFLAAMIAIVTIGLNAIFLRSEFYPLRWFAPGLALMGIMVIYPVVFTLYIAFTNYGTGNLLTKEQVVAQFEDRTYLPEEGGDFSWTAFRREGAGGESEFLLFLQGDDGQTLLTAPGETLTFEEVNAGPLDADGVPESIPGYERLERRDLLRYLGELDNIQFGNDEDAAFVRGMDSAAQVKKKYVYDVEQDSLIDQETGVIYPAIDGRFTSPDGDELLPGYYVTIGSRNFSRLFDPNNPTFRGPFIRIFVWTFAFAVLVVLSTFALGLFLAVIFNDPTLPGRKIIQSLLVVPYAVPAFISVMVWRGLLNPQFGIVSKFLDDVFGDAPAWFADPWWAKAGVLLVTLWLGFPYMFLICTGALQAIPGNIYEAAEIDGASATQRFWQITFPLLLVAVGPLLIGSFAFNFNNFTVIDVYNEGGPPIANSATPAGHTDILISYIVRLAFSGGRGVDYGYASAITIVIFVILATIVAFQFRYTRVWEEVSDSV